MKYLYTLLLILLFSQLSYSLQIKQDSITVAVAPEYNKVGKLRRFLFGENYRALWAVPVKLRILHLDSEKGGLTIEQRGGGMQSASLRLKDKSRQEWVLRSVQKDAARVLPANLRKGVAADILQDQVSTANPFAALTVPPLADALGIKHANPEIVYLSDDNALGNYRGEFANKVFLFEERQPEDVDKSENILKLQKKLKKDNDVSFNAVMVLRARLLDMILGDWDRHDDQWRWEKIKDGKQTTYNPIPRDRDQVYYKTSGVFPWLVSHQWLKSKFQPYGKNIRDIKAWNLNAQYFDRYFLNGLEKEDWEEQISYVQQHLTDAVIEAAFNRLPPAIYRLSAPQLITTMKTRRDNIGKSAMEYYRFLSQIVEIPATDKQELFDVSYRDSGYVDINISKLSKARQVKETTYHRTFDPKITKEIRLYGFDGQDVFKVQGFHKSPIKIRMIGGGDVDTFEVAGTVKNADNLYIYDREDEQNFYPKKGFAKLRLSADSLVNGYDKYSYRFDRVEPIILGEYNNDYGVSLIGGVAITRHGFRKQPYASRNEFLIKYSLARRSFEISYKGDFIKAIGDNNLEIDVHSRGPNNVSNFFGLGNETVFEKDHSTLSKNGEEKKPIEYYRNRYDLINADVRLSHNYNKLNVFIGVTGQYYTSTAKNNQDRYLYTYNLANVNQTVFSNRAYAGLTTGFAYDTRNGARPTKGMYLTMNLAGLQQLNGGSNRYGQLLTEFNFYLNPGGDSTFIIANRTGFGTTIGQAQFYQQLRLGGQQTLRGYHTGRFTGKTMVYNGIEFHLKALDFNSYLFPGSAGITAFNDIGRVWIPGESSSQWHDGYGGGIYLNPAEMLSIQFSKGFSPEGSINYFSLNYRF